MIWQPPQLSPGIVPGFFWVLFLAARAADQMLCDTSRMNSLIISCSAHKLPGSHRAVDLYQSRQFKIARQLQDLGWSVFVLSAKYGFIPGSEIIADYDQKMDRSRADQLADLLPAIFPAGPVYVYGGKLYRDVVNSWADRLGQLQPRELIGLNRGNGDHYRALAALLDS